MTPPKPLTGLEAGFLAYASRPTPINLQIGGLALFTGTPPEVEAGRRYLASWADEVPALAQALHGAGRRARWVVQPVLDPELQSGVWDARPGGLRDAVDAIMAQELPPGAPPWQCWLIRGYAEGEWAILVKAHHALLDGASLIQMACRLLGGAPDNRAPRRPRRKRRADLIVVARGLLRYAMRFLPPANGSFAFEGTGERRFAWATIPLAALRRVADRHGCTVNDVFLAALTTVLREWPHTPWRKGPRPVWTLVPADLHEREGVDEPAAKVVNLRVPLPCHEPDPRRRLEAVARATAISKRSGHIATGAAGSRALPVRFVSTMLRLTFSRLHIDLLASNMRGSRQALEYQGSPMTGMAPLGFIPRGHPFAAFLLSYSGQACIGFALDPALPDGNALCRLWEQAVEELDVVAPDQEPREVHS
ncbi:wax ester/triacylglycerol synthase domain-containing protein [Actinosynnema sp. NPDC051121]